MINISIPDSTPAGNYTLTPIATPAIIGVPKGASGCDFSQFNDVKDFLAVKNSGVNVCIHRATKGSTGLDSQFRNRWAEIVQTKFDFYGIYHLFIPGVKGSLQYDNLMSVTNGNFGNYPLTVDVEPIPSTQTYPDPLNEVINPLKELLGLIKSTYKPIVYTADWATQRMGLTQEAWLLDYPLHFAHYTTATVGVLPEPWRSNLSAWFSWQHWNKGIVPGVMGSVDLDRFNGIPFAV